MHEVTKIGNTRIRRALRGKRGRRVKAPPAPVVEKCSWAERALPGEGGREQYDVGKRGRKEKEAIRRRVRG